MFVYQLYGNTAETLLLIIIVRYMLLNRLSEDPNGSLTICSSLLENNQSHAGPPLGLNLCYNDRQFHTYTNSLEYMPSSVLSH